MEKKGANKKKKSAQVSFFIVIAIIIVAAIVIVFAVRGDFFNNGKDKVPPEVQPIYSYVEECIKTTAENGLYYIGQTGGYFASPNASTDYGIAYYYDRGNNLMPSKAKIEDELGEYMNLMLGFCTGDFSDYPDFNVKEDDIKTSVKIEEDKVSFNVVYPITISKGDKNYFFRNFGKTEIPVRLDRIYSLAYNITQDHMKNKNNVCASCINSDAIELDLYVEMNEHSDNESVIYTIRDAKSTLFEQDYRFYFANRYDK